MEDKDIWTSFSGSVSVARLRASWPRLEFLIPEMPQIYNKTQSDLLLMKSSYSFCHSQASVENRRRIHLVINVSLQNEEPFCVVVRVIFLITLIGPELSWTFSLIINSLLKNSIVKSNPLNSRGRHYLMCQSGWWTALIRRWERGRLSPSILIQAGGEAQSISGVHLLHIADKTTETGEDKPQRVPSSWRGSVRTPRLTGDHPLYGMLVFLLTKQLVPNVLVKDNPSGPDQPRDGHKTFESLSDG